MHVDVGYCNVVAFDCKRFRDFGTFCYCLLSCFQHFGTFCYYWLSWLFRWNLW